MGICLTAENAYREIGEIREKGGGELFADFEYFAVKIVFRLGFKKEKRPDTTPASIENWRSKTFLSNRSVTVCTRYTALRSEQRNQNSTSPFGDMSPVVVTAKNGYMSFTNPQSSSIKSVVM